jgi:hypothetical protein
MKVARVEGHPPDSFVDTAKFRDGEGWGAEGTSERRVLQLRARSLDPITQDARMIECERLFLDRIEGWTPGGARGVAPSHGRRQIWSKREVRHAHDSTPRVSLRCAVAAELLEMDRRDGKTRFLGELACRGIHEVLVRQHEPARERPPALVGRDPPADEQSAQVVPSNGEDHQVDRNRGDGEGRGWGHRMHSNRRLDEKPAAGLSSS